MIAINHIRAARYRALALNEKDQARAALLGRIAEEADHGLLCTVRHLHLIYSIETTAPTSFTGAGSEHMKISQMKSWSGIAPE
ncbi:MAG TPA: hypothetical protein VHJ00_20705 [Bradyrhizobium sp.]|nr:hypothetical protein [Bradyrhizobium sp.]